MEQPGYDYLAEQYDLAFPDPYLTALERHAVAAFAEMVLGVDPTGRVLDIGCGTGHVTADLARRGLDVVGIDPSEAMLGIARRSHPDVEFRRGEAVLDSRSELTDAQAPLCGVMARFSIIHVAPELIPETLRSWVDRMLIGGVVLLGFQSTDEEPVVPFDHAVAPAWRWRPDEMSKQLARVGFDEVWRTISRPDSSHRFPECHLAVTRRP